MIRAASPSITNLEKKFVMDALTNGWGANMSNYIDLFIKNFKKLCGKKYILTTANCTSAIHLALLSIGVKRGDEVIVPDLTWVASVSPITYLGAKPIFADVEKDSFCISVKSLKKNITKKTRAIIVVDLLGNMPEWEKILKLCKKKKN